MTAKMSFDEKVSKEARSRYASEDEVRAFVRGARYATSMKLSMSVQRRAAEVMLLHNPTLGSKWHCDACNEDFESKEQAAVHIVKEMKDAIKKEVLK